MGLNGISLNSWTFGEISIHIKLCDCYFISEDQMIHVIINYVNVFVISAKVHLPNPLSVVGNDADVGMASFPGLLSRRFCV